MVVAVLISGIFLIWEYTRVGEIDQMTILEVVLIVSMAGLSYFMNNDKLFKLQPVAVAYVSAAVLAYFQYFDTPLLLWTRHLLRHIQ